MLPKFLRYHEGLVHLKVREAALLHPKRSKHAPEPPYHCVRLMAVSYQSTTDLRSTTAMNHVKYCRSCLYQAHPAAQFLHTSSTKTFVHIRRLKFHDRPSVSIDNGQHKRELVHNQRCRTPTNSSMNGGASSSVQSGNCSFRRERHGVHPGLWPRRRAEAWTGPIGPIKEI